MSLQAVMDAIEELGVGIGPNKMIHYTLQVRFSHIRVGHRVFRKTRCIWDVTPCHTGCYGCHRRVESRHWTQQDDSLNTFQVRFSHIRVGHRVFCKAWYEMSLHVIQAVMDAIEELGVGIGPNKMIHYTLQVRFSHARIGHWVFCMGRYIWDITPCYTGCNGCHRRAESSHWTQLYDALHTAGKIMF